jgi:hypothetical protein
MDRIETPGDGQFFLNLDSANLYQFVGDKWELVGWGKGGPYPNDAQQRMANAFAAALASGGQGGGGPSPSHGPGDPLVSYPIFPTPPATGTLHQSTPTVTLNGPSPITPGNQAILARFTVPAGFPVPNLTHTTSDLFVVVPFDELDITGTDIGHIGWSINGGAFTSVGPFTAPRLVGPFVAGLAPLATYFGVDINPGDTLDFIVQNPGTNAGNITVVNPNHYVNAYAYFAWVA